MQPYLNVKKAAKRLYLSIFYNTPQTPSWSGILSPSLYLTGVSKYLFTCHSYTCHNGTCFILQLLSFYRLNLKINYMKVFKEKRSDSISKFMSRISVNTGVAQKVIRNTSFCGIWLYFVRVDNIFIAYSCLV